MTEDENIFMSPQNNLANEVVTPCHPREIAIIIIGICNGLFRVHSQGKINTIADLSFPKDEFH